VAQQLTNLTRIHKEAGSIPGLAQAVGHRHDSNLELPGLQCRPAAIALIQPTPSLGTFICHRCGPKKQNIKNKRPLAP